jgi:hypothetical protein
MQLTESGMVQPVLDALHMKDWYAAAALALMILVQLSKTPVLGRVWEKIPDTVRGYAIMLGGGVTAFIAAFVNHSPFPEAALAFVGGALGIGGGAMGANAILTQSHLPWNGGAGGVPRAGGTPDATKILPFILLGALASTQSACTPAQAVAAANLGSKILEVVTARTSQTNTVLDMIESELVGIERNLPPDVVVRVRQLIAGTRAVNAAALQAAETGNETVQEANARAADFRAEWSALMAELQSIGLANAGKFSAAPGHVAVPEPLAGQPVEVE